MSSDTRTLSPRRTFTKKQRQAFILTHGMTCAYCKKQGTEDKGPDGRSWHIDHFIPYSVSGNSEDENLRLACCHCNESKHNRRGKDFFTPEDGKTWQERQAPFLRTSFDADRAVRDELKRRAKAQGLTVVEYTSELLASAISGDEINIDATNLRCSRANPLPDSVRLAVDVRRERWFPLQYKAIYMDTTTGPLILALIERELRR